MSDITRLNVNLNAETAAALRKIQADRGISATEVIRRAIGLLAFIESETSKGRRIHSVSDKTTKELIFK